MDEAPRYNPYDAEAERAMLGKVFLGGADTLTEVADDLRAEHFYFPEHRHIYKAALHLFMQAESVDALTVAAWLEGKGLLEDVGGRYYLSQLLMSEASSAGVKALAAIVIKRATERGIWDIGHSMIRAVEACDAADDPDTTAARFSQQLDDLTYHTSAERESTGADVAKYITEYLDGKMLPPGLSTGLRALDTITAGLKPGEVWILAGQTGRGKTTLAIQILLHLAQHHRVPTQIYSFEMSERALYDSLVCHLAGVSKDYLNQLVAQAEEAKQPIILPNHIKTALRKAQTQFESIGGLVSIVAGRGLTIDQVAAQVRAKHRREALGLVVIDYAQKVAPTPGRFSREQEVSWISNVVSTIALTQNIPVLLLSQVNRKTDAREGKPRLGDLRESGALEQDADLVVFIRRPELDGIEEMEVHGQKIDTKHSMELIVEKNRTTGRLGRAHFSFNKSTMRYYDIDTRHEQIEESLGDDEVPF